MIVYFAGVNTTHFCEAFVGHHLLETFNDPRPRYGRYRAVFASMALDCGAYTAEFTTGVPIDIVQYADYCLEHGVFYEWMASLDSIKGGVEQNIRNWQYLTDRRLKTMPTWHQGEPLSVLRDYCAASDRIGLGFQRPIRDERAFLDEAFAEIPEGTLVHGWAMTGYTALYPFASVDSATWNRELLALRAMRPEYQEGFSLDHLTDRELIEIIQKKYERLPRMLTWGREFQARKRRQMGLFAKKGAA